MSEDFYELKLLIAANLDIYEILDILDLTIPELLDLLEEQLEENEEAFRRAVR